MSKVKILVSHQESGFSKIYIDGKYLGELEDLGEGTNVADVFRKIIKLGYMENTIVEEK